MQIFETYRHSEGFIFEDKFVELSPTIRIWKLEDIGIKKELKDYDFNFRYGELPVDAAGYCLVGDIRFIMSGDVRNRDKGNEQTIYYVQKIKNGIITKYGNNMFVVDGVGNLFINNTPLITDAAPIGDMVPANGIYNCNPELFRVKYDKLYYKNGFCFYCFSYHELYGSKKPTLVELTIENGKLKDKMYKESSGWYGDGKKYYTKSEEFGFLSIDKDGVVRVEDSVKGFPVKGVRISCS